MCLFINLVVGLLVKLCFDDVYTVISLFLTLFLVSLKDFRSQTLPEAGGARELQCIQRSCKTDHSMSSYDKRTRKSTTSTSNDGVNVSVA